MIEMVTKNRNVVSRLLKSSSRDFPVNFVKGDYTVKTLTSRRELLQVLRLRYDVFHREYRKKKFPFGIDKDRFDAICDHLIIIDNRTSKIVGTYRMIPSTRTSDFYSATELDIDGLLALPGTKVELGRACIHRDYRTGAVINLLWRGLVQYMQLVGADYLFGLASVKTTRTPEILAVYRALRHSGVIDESLEINAVGKYRISAFSELLDDVISVQDPSSASSTHELIPALLKSYLRAGARVVGEPAVDREFNCTDFLTILDLRKITKGFERKYMLC